jgi:hypothetical protein
MRKKQLRQHNQQLTKCVRIWIMLVIYLIKPV